MEAIRDTNGELAEKSQVQDGLKQDLSNLEYKIHNEKKDIDRLDHELRE